MEKRYAVVMVREGDTLENMVDILNSGWSIERTDSTRTTIIYIMSKPNDK